MFLSVYRALCFPISNGFLNNCLYPHITGARLFKTWTDLHLCLFAPHDVLYASEVFRLTFFLNVIRSEAQGSKRILGDCFPP